MARVFVSYRRADGAYGVGWIAERLRSLDSITGVETAFHDSELRAGDDFPDALDAEIADSDLLLAVIGPAWLGATGSGTARIHDPDDWVVREIATAFARGTRVVPVLMGGADHPLASQVHASIADITRLHALPFDNGRDLGTIVEHIESHLSEIDRQRATRAGLEKPIEVPRLDHPRRLTALTTLGVLAGMLLAAVSAYYLPAAHVDVDPLAPPPATGLADQTGWAWYGPLLILLGGFTGGFAVVGTVLARRVTCVATHQWPRLIGGFVLASMTVAVMILSAESGHLLLIRSESVNGAEWRGVSSLVVAVFAMVPLALVLVSPIFSSSRAAEHELGVRVQHLGIARDAERWGALGVAVIVTLGTGVGAALTAAALQAGELSDFEPFPLVGFAVITSMILVMVHVTAISRLRDRQADIERDLAVLPPKYRDNATPKLIATVLDDGGWGFRAILALPAVGAIVAVLLIWVF